MALITPLPIHSHLYAAPAVAPSEFSAACYRNKPSQSANVNSAVRLGYVSTGNATTTRSRKNSQWAATVSKRPHTRHTSHAGKNEPRMSKDGARLQLAQSVAESNSPQGGIRERWSKLPSSAEEGRAEAAMRPRLGWCWSRKSIL
jgi:hypothetical protein